MSRKIPQKRAFTLVELLVVIAIIGLLIALLLPAIQSAREAARRMACSGHLRQIALGLQNYAATFDRLPAGCVIDQAEYADGNYSAWVEAETGAQGTSWMLAILPYIEQQPLFDRWNNQTNVAGNRVVAETDIALFYCPSRRSGIRSQDVELMFLGITAGGTDYGGCQGRDNGYYNECSPVSHGCGHSFTMQSTIIGKANSYTGESEGRYQGSLTPNLCVRFQEILDGTSCTILVGELQRLVPKPGATSYERSNRHSDDGWAVGGVSTLFVTDKKDDGVSQPGGLNNQFFESAGSEHPGGAQFGMVDGAVHFIDDSIDQTIYSYLGSIRDERTTATW